MLTEEQKSQFYKLKVLEKESLVNLKLVSVDVDAYSPELKIFTSNRYLKGLFLHSCHLNSSGLDETIRKPNAGQTYSCMEELPEIKITALKDISKGEEIIRY